MPLKLTCKERQEVLAALAAGKSNHLIARKYGIHPGYVRQLKTLARRGKLPTREPTPRKFRLIKAAGY